MGIRGLLLRGLAVLALAAAAGHVAQLMRPGTDLSGTTRAAAPLPQPAPAQSVPLSASLGGIAAPLPALVGITPVAAELPTADACAAALVLAPAPGAMIDLALRAPCNAGQRIVIRHAGLAFTARTDATGTARLALPAFQADAVVTVYLEGSAITLGQIQVPEAAQQRRIAFQWASPERFTLRATIGEQVFVGTPGAAAGPLPVVLALGTSAVPDPMQAQVYTVPPGIGGGSLAVELAVGPETCGRTLAAQTVTAEWGQVTLRDIPVAVPLCGTVGDILVLKNLLSDLTLALPG